MIKIGVIADTHITDSSVKIPKQIEDIFTCVDCIIHCGDFINNHALTLMTDLGKPVYAVWGNMDVPELKAKLPEKRIIGLGGIRIGLFHGEGAPDEVRSSVERAFNHNDVDVFVFGHSHKPLNLLERGKLFFNPGSAFDKRWAPYCTVGVLTITNGQCRGEIFPLANLD